MTEVVLNVYDVTNPDGDSGTNTISVVNNVTHAIGLGGIFHGAVEIYGEEWSFGFCERGTGVYNCPSKRNPFYIYRQTLVLGKTNKSVQEVSSILARLKFEWQGPSYNLLNRNCCNFCEDFCEQLGVGPVPTWLNRMATGAEAAINFTDKVVGSFMTMSNQIQQGSQTSMSWLRQSFKNWTNPVVRNGEGGQNAAPRPPGEIQLPRTSSYEARTST